MYVTSTKTAKGLKPVLSWVTCLRYFPWGQSVSSGVSGLSSSLKEQGIKEGPCSEETGKSLCLHLVALTSGDACFQKVWSSTPPQLIGKRSPLGEPMPNESWR